MSPSAASIAARVRGPIPSGFSFDASLMMFSSLSPSSRATSEIGLPGWYGAIERTYDGESSHRSINMRFLVTPSGYGDRVRTQYLEVRRFCPQRRQRGRDVLVLLMALDVDKKEIFPQRGARARRARLDAAHAHTVRGERGEQRVHRARLVLRRHDERGPVAPARRRIDVAEHEKARGVVRVVLDGARERGEPVALPGGLAGDRRRALLLRGALRSLGVRGHRHALGVRQVLRQPAVALREGLGMRVHLLDGAEFL